MTSEEKSVPPTRGTIIVDGSALMNMWGLISPQLQAEDIVDARRYVDLLRFLAASGFEIVIPEIVSAVCARTLKDGRDINRFFPKKHRAYDTSDKILADFLKDVAGGNIPHIRIEPPQVSPPSPSAAYIQGLDDALQQPIGIVEGGSKGQKRNIEWGIIQVRLKRAQAAYQGDLVPNEILYMLDHAYAGYRGPVFIFANSNSLRNRIQAECRSEVELLTSRQLAYSLVDTGLHNRAGFRTSASAAQIANDMWMGTRQNRDVSTVQEPPHYLDIVRKSAFHAALSRLAAELGEKEGLTALEISQGDTAPPPEPRDPQAQGGDTSEAIQRFLARRAKTAALQNDRGGPRK